MLWMLIWVRWDIWLWECLHCLQSLQDLNFSTLIAENSQQNQKLHRFFSEFSSWFKIAKHRSRLGLSKARFGCEKTKTKWLKKPWNNFVTIIALQFKHSKIFELLQLRLDVVTWKSIARCFCIKISFPKRFSHFSAWFTPSSSSRGRVL